MFRIVGCVTQQHDLRLVILAACICILACFTTLNLLARAQATRDASRAWLATAAVVFGCGVWSLHFVAMLAFMPGMPIAYDIRTTASSAVIAVIGTLTALLCWRLTPSRWLGTGLGGVLLGLAVAGMHYCGVAAMRLPFGYRVDHQQVLASVLVGVGFATLSLARSVTLSSLRRRIEVSGWLGLCVCGVHFTGMSALSIGLGHPVGQRGAVVGSGSLAIAVGSVSLAILAVSLAATLMEQHLSQRAVLELRRMRLLSDISQEVLIIERGGIILQINTAGGRLFGVPAERLVGREVLDLVAQADHPTVLKRVRDIVRDGRPEEIQVRTGSGALIAVELSCSTIDYEGRTATAIAFRDLTDRKRDEARIRHLAHHDALTDLPNRFLLQERLSYALDAATASKAEVALLYIDLDRFKPINDLLGHGGGDSLLIQVAQRLQAELRATDTLARVGGDEFVVVMNTGRAALAASLAQRLIDSIARPFDLDGHQVEIGTSVGIALFPGDCSSQDTLMHAADTALYRAKQDRRGTFRFFEAAMDENLQARRQLEQDLRHAVDRGEFELYYQPLVSCTTEEVEGYEALLRWHHPQRGLVPPMEFIPLAEETGLIVKISQWVLQAACQAAAGWERPHRVAVNISPVQFRQSDLPQTVAETLASTGLLPSRLEIEITEGVLMEDTARAIEILSALRAQGVRIALDDFGTGYSSLSYLRSFRFDKLKIDRSFIQGLEHGEEATMIVRTIIGLAHNLGLSIVAEGIETTAQLEVIRDHRCDQMQGYLLGRPRPMGDPDGRARLDMPRLEARAPALVP